MTKKPTMYLFLMLCAFGSTHCLGEEYRINYDDFELDEDGTRSGLMDNEENAVKTDEFNSCWKKANCFKSGCHRDLNSDVEYFYECGECHGRNGADDNCGHGPKCMSCHGEDQHKGQAAKKNIQCVTCHVN